MPSTFTDRLRIVLQATGENDGTWGALTNDSALKLIDDAIAGVQLKDIAGSGNVSLTVNNGALDESRKAILKLSGTLTGDRNVIVPSVEKSYIVDASGVTLADHTLTIKTSGGTGVTLTGLSLIYCDGTDVYEAASVFDTSVLGALAFLDTVGSSQIDDNSITNAKMADNSVDTAELVDESVTAAKLSPGVIPQGVPSGFFSWFCGTSVPSGWLVCDGSAVSRTTYADLFAAIGTTHGSGDGSTTFNLPPVEEGNRFIRAAGGSLSVGDTQSSTVGNFNAVATGQVTSWDTGSTPTAGSSNNPFGANTNLSSTVSATMKSYSYNTGSSETRPVNIAFLPCIKT